MDFSENTPFLNVQNVSIGYVLKKAPFVVAENLNFTASKGKLICLLGKNGAGKSTLLRTLSKTQKPLSGTISLDNKNLISYSDGELAKKMSLVLTEKIPDSQLTVLELISLGRQPYTNWLGTISKEDAVKIEEAISLTNIENLLSKKHYELSDGQLQKVLIARALAQDTELILLDEPTAHLDMHHKIEVFKLLKKLVTETQKTIIMSTHEVNLSLKIADELWMMLDNNFVTGTLENHIANNHMELLFPTEQLKFDFTSNQYILEN